MHVKIGPYRNWLGPYQFANLLRYVGASEEFTDWLGEKMPAGPFNWIDSFKHRKIKVKIDQYDTWSMDHTLALIIYPMLIQLRDTKHGSPFVDNDDVPEELKSTSAPPLENEWDTDEFFHDRWTYVINEMIFSFEKKLDEDWESPYFNRQGFVDRDGYHAMCAKIDNGFRLFGKYYQGLWD